MQNKKLFSRISQIQFKHFQGKSKIRSILNLSCIILILILFTTIIISCGGLCESDTDCPGTKICSGYESLFWDGRVCVYSDKDLVLASDFNTNCPDALPDSMNLDTETESELTRQCIDGDHDDFGGTGNCDRGSSSFDCNDNQEDIYPGADEECDDIDNDCDGLIDALDPNMIPRFCANQTGVCEGATASCVQGEFQWCSEDEYRNQSDFYSPFEEGNELLCDNLDNDCDGQIDEDIEKSCYSGPEDTMGLGICNSGTHKCEAGNWAECLREQTPEEETCVNSGEDNNCDGILDNVAEMGSTCVNEDLTTCREGIFQCVDGILSCVPEPIDVLESCNDRDDNCDGLVDDAVYCDTTLSCGDTHCCVLSVDGIAHCWGNNSYGQSSPPDRIFKHITSGVNYTCGLLEEGTVECWGLIEEGPESEFAQIDAGTSSVCGSKSNNTVECWGENSVEHTFDNNIVQVTVGFRFFCTLTINGQVECTDQNFGSGERFQQLSINTSNSGNDNNICGINHNDSLECYADFPQNNRPDGLFSQVSVGGSFACAIQKADSTVECWGHDSYGVLNTPPEEFIRISAGSLNICGLRQNGTVECWGDNTFGQSDPQLW